MKALALLKTGSADDLALRDDIPVPTIREDEVLVKVGAAALNRVDQVIMRGYPGLAMSFPHILGADIAGEVADVGKNAGAWKPGDRVCVYPLISCGACTLCSEGKPNLCERWQYFGMHRPGGFAEFVAVPGRNLSSISSDVATKEAASVGVSGITALHALNMNPDLRPGSSLLVWGATGGVGTLLTQFAKLRGLSVIATTRDASNADRLRHLGADHVLDSGDEQIVQKVKDLHPSGLDQVVDYVGPATFGKSFQMLKKGGTMTLCGILTGMETPFSIHQAYFRHLRIQGVYLGTVSEYREILNLIATKKIEIPIASAHTLKHGAGALADFGSKAHFGKVVIQPNE